MADVRQATIVAAKWWTEAISHPTPNSFNNGDRASANSFMMMMVGQRLAEKNAAKPEQLEAFFEILTKRIESELDKETRVQLDCDYGPCNILGEAAEEVGINTCLFPFKRRMNITTNSVEVKDGYDADWKMFYSEILD